MISLSHILIVELQSFKIVEIQLYKATNPTLNNPK